MVGFGGGEYDDDARLTGGVYDRAPGRCDADELEADRGADCPDGGMTAGTARVDVDTCTLGAPATGSTAAAGVTGAAGVTAEPERRPGAAGPVVAALVVALVVGLVVALVVGPVDLVATPDDERGGGGGGIPGRPAGGVTGRPCDAGRVVGDDDRALDPDGNADVDGRPEPDPYAGPGCVEPDGTGGRRRPSSYAIAVANDASLDRTSRNAVGSTGRRTFSCRASGDTSRNRRSSTPRTTPSCSTSTCRPGPRR